MKQTQPLTTDMLKTLTGFDLEDLCGNGEAARLKMSGLVHSALQLSDSWRMDCEMRGEWGGAHPVHLRLTQPDASGVAVELVSPSACWPVWCAVVADSRTRSRLRLYVSDELDPVALQAKLLKIAEYTRAGFTGDGELVAAMRMGGHAA
ncbi:conjugation system SOS inhibitor PsiB family protein [Pantoea piersonii]|uniref:conjugation system SOS inhibitor PsiB family protein n=1 Tax=Pantoea TaxID=53335 RepID=UPI0028AE04A2|nr:conjugation system SOS inhibitor PsiB family protein [Pantoea piersonii]